jgi:hypothetical protein
MYALVCNHMQGANSAFLELGFECTSLHPRKGRAPTVVITVPHVLRRALVDMKAYWWIVAADVYFLDNLLMPGIPEWEEILLGMPSRALLCILAPDLSEYERDELPLWLETVQNCVVPVAPTGATDFRDRVDRPVDIPLLRAFVYNAAMHRHPVQVSIPLVVDELKKELDRVAADSAFIQRPGNVHGGWTGERRKSGASEIRLDPNPLHADESFDYASALLHGIQVISAEDVNELTFEDRAHAQYADVAALVVADAKDTSSNLKSRPGRRRSSGHDRKKTNAAMNAAASRRRRRAESVLLPAIVLAHGSSEAETVVGAVVAALHEAAEDVVYDADASDVLTCVIKEFRVAHGCALSADDDAVLFGMERGIGMAHSAMLPALRMLSEELFRDGLISVLVVDSYLGPREIAALPRARSVLIQASCLAEQSDCLKGLLKGTVAANLAGRPGLDDVGNLIVLWFDDEIEDAEASCSVAASLFVDDFTPRETQIGLHAPGQIPLTSHVDALFNYRYASSSRQRRSNNSTQRRSGSFLTSYRGLMGTLRRHDLEGYKVIISYTLDSYRGWLVGAALCATREKIELEQRAVDERIQCVDWDELALHERLEAKLAEQLRLLEAMDAHRRSVLSETMFEDLRTRHPGILIGMQRANDGRGDRSKRLPSDSALSTPERAPYTSAMDSAGKDKVLGSDAMLASTGGSSIEVRSSMIPAVLVAVYDNARGQAQPSVVKSSVLVVCITLDGLWTLVPIEDVRALDTKSTVIPNVDLIPVPHLATFDRDPLTGWAKCKPCSEPEISRVAAVVDQLAVEVTDTGNICKRLKTVTLPELEKQEDRVESARKLFLHSAWYGREQEIAELRRLRRRSVKLGDDGTLLRKSEKTLETGLRNGRRGFDARMRAQLAVLEDCNAVSVPDEDDLIMTPIGVLASVLPGSYPVFGAACLTLVSRLDELSPAELCGFISLVMGVPPPFLSTSRRRSSRLNTTSGRSTGPSAEGVQDITYSDQSQNSFSESWSGEGEVSPSVMGRARGLVRDVDDLEGVLPLSILQETEDIRRALQVVHRRHFNVENPVNAGPQIAPSRLEAGMARAIHHFADGKWAWQDVVTRTESEPGSIVSHFRGVVECLNVIRREDAGLGELADVQAAAAAAFDALHVWPLSDLADVDLLIRNGVGARRFTTSNRNATYKSWWARARVEVELADQRAEETVESAQAEVMSPVEDQK